MFMPLSHATWSWSLSCHLVMVMVMFMSLGHGHGNVHVTWSCHLVIVKVNVYLIRGHDSLPTLIPFTNLQYISLFTNISILPTIRVTWQPPIQWNVSEFPPGRGECWNTEPDVAGVREGAWDGGSSQCRERGEGALTGGREGGRAGALAGGEGVVGWRPEGGRGRGEYLGDTLRQGVYKIRPVTLVLFQRCGAWVCGMGWGGLTITSNSE